MVLASARRRRALGSDSEGIRAPPVCVYLGHSLCITLVVRVGNAVAMVLSCFISCAHRAGHRPHSRRQNLPRRRLMACATHRGGRPSERRPTWKLALQAVCQGSVDAVAGCASVGSAERVSGVRLGAPTTLMEGRTQPDVHQRTDDLAPDSKPKRRWRARACR